MDIRIGTSGWHYKHWVGPFYPSKLPAPKMLTFYLERFNTVEVNNSFYRLPSVETLEQWRRSTPEDFCFAVKGSRYLTHAKKLKDPGQGIERLMSRIEVLDEKLGPILFQLPPRWGVDVERLEGFLSALPRGHRYAFEFRQESWNDAPVYDLLRKFGAAFCIFHLAGFQSPLEITTDFAYIRLHGPGGKYQGSYTDEDLRAWADRIRLWREKLRKVYVYFDNDQAGYAAANALRLKQLLN